MHLDILDAEKLLIHGSPEEAYALISKHSGEENPRVMFLTGEYYVSHNTKETAEKHDEALRWYKKGSALGDVLCKYCEAQYIQSNEERHFAVSGIFDSLLQMAEQGDVYAQYFVGCCYFSGEGTDENCRLALEWTEKSADQGYTAAQYRLGFHYEMMEKDYNRALEWYTKAAEQGDSRAQVQLGYFYTYNSHKLSKEWYERAAAQGNKEARSALLADDLDDLDDLDDIFGISIWEHIKTIVTIALFCITVALIINTIDFTVWNKARQVEDIDYKGVIYTGGMEKGDPHGNGRIVFPNGGWYDGDWIKGFQHGTGTEFGINDDGETWTYTGDFVSNRFQGKGKMTISNGSWYEGDWMDGRESGEGVLFIVGEDGEAVTYTGEFANGALHGKGKIVFSKSGSWYEGDWLDGKRTGRGRYTYPSGNVYEGDFIDGVRNGKGTFTWVGGDQYIGDWIDDKQTGDGILIGADGNIYIGGFKENLYNGYGKFIYSDGAVLEGNWKDGEYIGKS